MQTGFRQLGIFTLMASVLIGSVITAPGISRAQTSTQKLIDDCRLLSISSGRVSGGAANCQGILEGAIGAFGLLSKKFYPISAQLGYCITPGLTPKELSGKLVSFADANPECGQLAHFSMCLNMALQSIYAKSC